MTSTPTLLYLGVSCILLFVCNVGYVETAGHEQRCKTCSSLSCYSSVMLCYGLVSYEYYSDIAVSGS